MSKTRSLHHIVFATKGRKRVMPLEHKKELYAYILGILRNINCHLLRINGVSDHIHMLVDIHPTISLSTMMQEVKRASSKWLAENPRFPTFSQWGAGYYAVSIGTDQVEACKQYIINQEDHHLKQLFIAEMEWMALKHGLAWHKDDWE